METILVASTAIRELRPLAAGGMSSVQAYAQLTRYLSQNLSPEHAALFAEPSQDIGRGVIDWFAPATGPVQRLTEVEGATRAAIEQRLGQLVADIQARGAALRESGRDSERLIGELLEVALEMPGRDHIYRVGDRPVLVAWGHGPQQPGAERGVLLSFVRPRGAARPPAAPAAIEPPPTAAMAPRRRKLPAALLATLAILLLMVALGWWAWPRLAAAFPLPAPVCRIDPQETELIGDVQRERSRESALRRQLAELRVAIAARRVGCAPEQRADLGGGQRRDGSPGADTSLANRDPKTDSTRDVERARTRGATDGTLQLTLAWDDRNDLDLIVVCPDRSAIFFKRRSGCGGELDVDANNVEGGEARDDPAEHIVWREPPKPGHYVVRVRLQTPLRADSTSPYRLTIRQPGQPDRQIAGRISAAQPDQVIHEFDVPAP